MAPARAADAAAVPEPVATALFTQQLTDIPGKQVLMSIVDYALPAAPTRCTATTRMT